MWIMAVKWRNPSAIRIMGLKINPPLTFQRGISEQEELTESMSGLSGEKTTQEQIGFLSEEKGPLNDIAPSIPRAFTNDSIDTMYLQNFLSRPVNIYSYTWAETDARGTAVDFDPWYLFFNDARIKYKLNNFAFLQCTLKLKIVINASPFYYGATLANYLPLYNLNPSTSESNGNGDQFIELSQRPHLWIYPQDNCGGEITLPYLNYRTWTRTHLTQDFRDLGHFYLEVVDMLKSANGTTGTGVVVSIFAWAENVNISGATLGLTMAQAGDEYGIVSTPSSMIAAAASKLTDMPIIGPFARATVIGAGAISSIARLFGFTNVPNLKDVDPMQPRAFHNFADTSISFPIDKLTVDPKNELSISQEVAGIKDEDDPLCIDAFIRRESYLTQFQWSTTNNAGDLLWKCDVSPAMCVADNGFASSVHVHSTPMGYASAMFSQWRGDIIFRFKILASRFHKGRVRIIFDPLGDNTNNIVSVSNSYSGCFNQIVDLGEETNIEFTVPYSQATYFQNVPDFGVTPFESSDFTFSRDISKHNGTLAIRCVTALTAPIASSFITVLVSVRSRNVEFANPNFRPGTSLRHSLKAPQSGSEYSVPGTAVVAGTVSSSIENMYDIVFGERIVSFRQLIKRMCLVYSIDFRNATTDYAIQYLVFGRFPPSFGYSANGLLSAVGIVTPANSYAFDWSPLSYLTWLTPCFAGQRGSINYAVSYAAPGGVHKAEISIQRNPGASVTTNTFGSQGAPGVNYSTYGNFMTGHYTGFSNGGSLACGYTNQGFEFQVPMLVQYKFGSTRITHGTTRNTDDGSDKGTVTLRIRSRPVQYQDGYNVYAGAGTDFNLIFFVNCPVVYIYNAIPTPGNII
jgi:hypothetical protein